MVKAASFGSPCKGSGININKSYNRQFPGESFEYSRYNIMLNDEINN